MGGPVLLTTAASSCARWDSFLFNGTRPVKGSPATLPLSDRRHERRSGNQRQVFSRENVAGRRKHVAQYEPG